MHEGCDGPGMHVFNVLSLARHASFCVTAPMHHRYTHTARLTLTGGYLRTETACDKLQLCVSLPQGAYLLSAGALHLMRALFKGAASGGADNEAEELDRMAKLSAADLDALKDAGEKG